MCRRLHVKEKKKKQLMGITDIFNEYAFGLSVPHTKRTHITLLTNMRAAVLDVNIEAITRNTNSNNLCAEWILIAGHGIAANIIKT